MPISQMILPEFEHEMANTRKTLERVPDDKFAWKPHEKSMSLGGLSTHLANIPSWTANTFDVDELDIAPRREDGTLQKPVTIWVVRVCDDLYVRSYKGHAGRWFRGTQVRHEGYIRADDIEKDVTFTEEVNPDVNDQIDAVYKTKYRRYAQYVPPILTPEARSTTIKLEPR